MSNSTSSRGSSRGAPQRPSTPDHSRTTITRTASSSVAPKSEYLRNALQARRAQNTPTPSTPETRAPLSPAARPSDLNISTTSPDMFDEFALTEEQTAPVSPIRRRRPSEAGPPRSKTNRELTNEIEKLKESFMTSNMRIELLKKSNSELQHAWTKTKEQLEALEPLEQENYDLLHENNHLKHKLENMEEEIETLKDDNDNIRQNNEELTAIANESAEHWGGQEFAIEEAAECIIKMEEEKTLLLNELKQLKDRVQALEENPPCTLVDDNTRYPSRVYSVDESRPSTSHFDSDYYSQPGSPHVRTSRESMTSFAPSERSDAKKFLDLSEQRRKSARDLVKRMSAASLKALSIRSPSPPPEIPQIPAAFQQRIPQMVEGDKVASKSPARYRTGRDVVPQSLMDEVQSSSIRASSKRSQAPSPQPEGLRGLYRPDKTVRSRTSNESRSPSSRVGTPKATNFANHQMSVAGSSPRVPSRSSTKHAHATSSNEQLESDMNLSPEPPTTAAGSASSEWASLAPPSSISVVTERDLTTELDPRDDKDRWWRSMDRLTLSQVVAQSQLATQQQATLAPLQTTLDVVRGPSRKAGESTTSTESLRSGGRKSKSKTTTPSTYEQKNFLFNGSEDTETFMQKVKGSIGKRQP